MKPRKSLRSRLTVQFALMVALLMAGTCSGVIWYVRSNAEHSASQLLESASERIQIELTQGVQHFTLPQLLEADQELASENLSLLLLDRAGNVRWRSRPVSPFWPAPERHGWRTVTVTSGQDIFVVGLPWQKTEESLRRLTLLLTALGLVVTVAVSGGAWLLIGHTLLPIGRLAGQARMASVYPLRVELAAPSDDAELVELVSTLNGLLYRLSESVEARARFYLAVSHELRTPLQALSGHLELALERRRSEEEYRNLVCEAHQQSQRLISLVKDLLLLTRLESVAAIAREPVSLTDICDQWLKHYAGLAQERGLRLVWEQEQDFILDAPLNHVEMLVRNLLENAHKYAAAEGEVMVTLTESAEAFTLQIFNTCLRLPEEVVRRLTEPFYRPDVSRSAETGGNGLGLAICKAITDANGWAFDLTSQSGGLLCTVLFAQNPAARNFQSASTTSDAKRNKSV